MAQVAERAGSIRPSTLTTARQELKQKFFVTRTVIAIFFLIDITIFDILLSLDTGLKDLVIQQLLQLFLRDVYGHNSLLREHKLHSM